MVASALVLSLILKTFFFQSFWIPSSSMEPLLVENDRILVSKWGGGQSDLTRGDVVVFKDPGGWLNLPPAEEYVGPRKVVNDALTFTGLLPADAGEHLVKRIIGLPGDVVECAGPDAAVTVNGTALVEPYVAEGARPCGREYRIEVPAGYLWLLGDNRDNSADSRSHMGDPGGGAVPIDAVVGRAFVTVWPVEHWTGIDNPFEDDAE